MELNTCWTALGMIPLYLKLLVKPNIEKVFPDPVYP